jgi:hypothetical protein
MNMNRNAHGWVPNVPDPRDFLNAAPDNLGNSNRRNKDTKLHAVPALFSGERMGEDTPVSFVGTRRLSHAKSS